MLRRKTRLIINFNAPILKHRIRPVKKFDVGATLRGRPRIRAIIGRAGDPMGSPLRANGFSHSF